MGQGTKGRWGRNWDWILAGRRRRGKTQTGSYRGDLDWLGQETRMENQWGTEKEMRGRGERYLIRSQGAGDELVFSGKDSGTRTGGRHIETGQGAKEGDCDWKLAGGESNWRKRPGGGRKSDWLKS